MIDEIAAALAALADRIAHVEQRLERLHRKGTVTDVDADKHLIRMRIGGTDDAPQKSAWIQYSQIAGARKTHSMPSVGQQMLMVSPDGDFEQSFAVPLSWSNANPSPSSSADEHIDDVANTRVTISSGTYTIKADKIVLDGNIFLGGADASNEASMRGTVDTAGDSDVSGLSTKVKLK